MDKVQNPSIQRAKSMERSFNYEGWNFINTSALGWFRASYVLSTSAAEKEAIDKNSEVINWGVCVGQGVIKMALKQFAKA
jgi:hypothetical protein